MPWLGAHLSVAGGTPAAVARAVALGCDALQIFTCSPGQWRARRIPDHEAQAFRDAASRHLRVAFSHASYLINLAAEGDALSTMSQCGLGDELDRAEALGLRAVVLHPGAHPDRDRGLRLIAERLLRVLDARPSGRARILLEHTAGQGNSLGGTFEQIAELLHRAGRHPRLGVCLDTCHLLASGYDITERRRFTRILAQFDRTVGWQWLQLVHLNDSKRPCGSRVDRHTHIGQGYVGIEPFRLLLNHPRFARMPMVIETEKSGGRRQATRAARVDPDPLDVMNLGVLRGLLQPRRQRRASRVPARRDRTD